MPPQKDIDLYKDMLSRAGVNFKEANYISLPTDSHRHKWLTELICDRLSCKDDEINLLDVIIIDVWYDGQRRAHAEAWLGYCGFGYSHAFDKEGNLIAVGAWE